MELKNKKIYSLMRNAVVILFSLMMLCILYILLFVAKNREFPCKANFIFSNITLLVIGLLLNIFLVLFYNKFIRDFIDKLTKKQCNIILLAYFACCFVLQIFFIKKIFFLTGWDVGVLRYGTEQILNGLKLNGGNSVETYIQTYPNNSFLLFVCVIISKFAIKLGIDSNLTLSAIGALSVNISGFLMVKIVAKVSKNKHLCILSTLVYTFFILFSPWIVIPYSDTYSMIFTVLILYIYLNKDNLNKYLVFGLILFCSFIGYKIKPTVIIVLIAITILEIWNYLFKLKKINFATIAKFFMTFCLIYISFLSIVNYSNSYIGYEKNEEAETPLTHFLMMGLNSETKGVYYQNDVDYTQSIKGKDNKKKANLKIIKKRLKEYGIYGYSQLLVDKILINYGDGTFAWGVEGNFYYTVSDTTSRLSSLLKNIYYNDGNCYIYYSTFVQMVWILILFFSLFSVLIKTNKTTVIYLTIIGITLFLLLFEARARYLFLYAPYYILTSILGFQKFTEIKSKFRWNT